MKVFETRLYGSAEALDAGLIDAFDEGWEIQQVGALPTEYRNNWFVIYRKDTTIGAPVKPKNVLESTDGPQEVLATITVTTPILAAEDPPPYDQDTEGDSPISGFVRSEQ